jgi:hypothetical protein
LFYDLPAQTIVVDNVNIKNKTIHFVSENKTYGHFLYKDFDINPQSGDILQVRFFEQIDKSSNFYKAATIEKSTQKIPETILKNIEGKINIKQGNSYGFIKNIFVSPGIINNKKLQNGDIVKATALYSYHKKNKQWTWKIIKIND